MLLMFDINRNTASILLQGDAGGANSGRSIASILKKAIMQCGAPHIPWYLSKKGTVLKNVHHPGCGGCDKYLLWCAPSLTKRAKVEKVWNQISSLGDPQEEVQLAAEIFPHRSAGFHFVHICCSFSAGFHSSFKCKPRHGICHPKKIFHSVSVKLHRLLLKW